ncbi:MAG: D-2-hydroxyacid dehydrogenase [Planctomycetota bacterium]|nr:D-2-hydroxyacid dehydrogenase [Planctomycetota bacterium]
MRLVLCYPVEAHHIAQIAKTAPELEIVSVGQEEIAEAILTADLFCGHAKVPVDWDRVVEQGRLVWTQSSAAGLDWLLAPSVIASQMIVTSASGVLGDQVAEHTVALLTAITRSLPVFFRAQQKKEYIRRPTRDLTHAKVGIVGLGGVGRRVAQVLAPFKTRILAVDLFPVDKPAEVAELWPADRLDDLLPQCDVVILCLPLNQQTRWIMNADKFALMKQGSIFMNMARGKLVVEEALVAALQSGKLFAAAADVAAEEPLPLTSPLWELPNMLITPHVAGQSAKRIDNMTDFFCENLRRYHNGLPLNNLVDKNLGFPIRQARAAL